MIRSTRSDRPSRASTEARSARPCTASSGRPSVARAARTVASRAALEWRASRPPLRSTALPLLRARALICTSASGRDSKITPSTPRGQDSRVSSRPASSSRRRSTRPRGSGRAATARTPAAISCSLAGLRRRRWKAAGLMVPCAAARSRALAARMASASARRPAASASSTRLRVAPELTARVWAAARAATACPRTGCSAGSSGAASGLAPNRVPTGSPARMRSRMRGSRPEASTTATPRSAARRAAPTLLAMPPRPRPLRPARSTSSAEPKGTSPTGVALGSRAGLLVWRADTSDSSTSRSASRCMATRAERWSLSLKTGVRPSAGRSSSRVDTVSFSLSTGTAFMARRASRVRLRLAWRVASEKSSSVSSTWAAGKPRRPRPSAYSDISSPWPTAALACLSARALGWRPRRRAPRPTAPEDTSRGWQPRAPMAATASMSP